MFDFSIFSILAGIGTLVAGIGFAYSQFKTGSVKAKDELIETLRDTAKAEKEKAERLAAEKVLLINSHQQQINELSAKIGKLQGLYEANEKEKQNYLAILQGRSPEQVEFMKLMTNAATQSNVTTEAAQKYMTDTITILGEIKTFMQSLNAKANKTEEWHENIDAATKAGAGNPLRKKV